jgi:GTP-binding protein
LSPFQQASFFASAAKPTDLPPEGRPEIAFAGRSNVGKSSAINALAGRRRLAFVSKTPGRTQMINFFDLGGAGWLVDLPGYGYAKVPQALRAGWEELVGGYLSSRQSLAGVVALMDARHPLTQHDRRLLDWLRPRALPCLVLLTKSDKLSRAERQRTLAQVRSELSGAGLAAGVMLFSSASRDGVEEARARLEGWLRDWGPGAGNKRPPAKGKPAGGKTP